MIDAVKAMHPEHVFKIPEEKNAACCTFLEDYLVNDGYVFRRIMTCFFIGY